MALGLGGFEHFTSFGHMSESMNNKEMEEVFFYEILFHKRKITGILIINKNRLSSPNFQKSSNKTIPV